MKTTVRKWITEMRDQYRDDPFRAPLYFVYSWYLMMWFGLASRYPIGTNVYERDWDVLIILDACRTDTLREVADEYDFIENVDEMWSIGSHSAEWIAQTFTEAHRPEVEKTRYITGNAHASRILEQRMTPPMNNIPPLDFSRWRILGTDAFDAVEMVWEDHHDQTYRVALPDVMTDFAINAGREQKCDRLMVHYMQPHLPYIGRAVSEGREPTDLEVNGYEKLESGEADRDEVYNLYKDTLRFVLDEVEVLLENLDAEKVAITADHGEAFGEMQAYGHPEGFPHPIVKKVPWIETSAQDDHTREPDLETDRGINVEIEEHLEDLGYK